MIRSIFRKKMGSFQQKVGFNFVSYYTALMNESIFYVFGVSVSKMKWLLGKTNTK